MATGWRRLRAWLARALGRPRPERRAERRRHRGPEPATPEAWRAYVEARDPAWFTLEAPRGEESGRREPDADGRSEGPPAGGDDARHGHRRPSPSPVGTPPRTEAARDEEGRDTRGPTSEDAAARGPARPVPRQRHAAAAAPARAEATAAPTARGGARARDAASPARPVAAARARPQAPDAARPSEGPPPEGARPAREPLSRRAPWPRLARRRPARIAPVAAEAPDPVGTPGEVADPAATPPAPVPTPMRPPRAASADTPADTIRPSRDVGVDGAERVAGAPPLPPEPESQARAPRAAAARDPWPALPEPQTPAPPGIAARAWATGRDALRAEQRSA